MNHFWKWNVRSVNSLELFSPRNIFTSAHLHYVLRSLYTTSVLSSAIAQSNEGRSKRGSRLANLSQYQNDQRLKIRVNFHYAWLAYCFVIFFSSVFYRLQLHSTLLPKWSTTTTNHHQVLIAHAKPKQTVLTLNPIRNKRQT